MIASFLLLLSFLLGNTHRLSFFSPDVHFSFLDISIIFITLSSLLFHRSTLLVRLSRYRSLTISIFVFFTIALLSLVLFGSSYGPQAFVVGSFYLARWLIYSLCFASLPIKPQNILLSLGICLIITSFTQYLFFPDIRHLQISEWDPHYYRVVGSLLDPGFTGILLVLFLIFLDRYQALTHKLLWFLSYLALALTYSRSSYLAFLASMTYLSWRKKSWKFLASILLLFTITICLLPRSPDGEGVKLERTSTIQARLASWKTAGTIFLHHPILGVGFNTYRYAQGASLTNHAGAGADSSLLFVAATTGLVGLLSYLWYLRNLELTTTLVALLVHSLFLNSLFYPWVMVWLSLLVLSESDSPLDPQH